MKSHWKKFYKARKDKSVDLCPAQAYHTCVSGTLTTQRVACSRFTCGLLTWHKFGTPRKCKEQAHAELKILEMTLVLASLPGKAEALQHSEPLQL